MRTKRYKFSSREIDDFSRKADGLSYADMTTAVTNAVKTMVLDSRQKLDKCDVIAALDEISAQRNNSA
jgi:diaminopimelate decarboxylase